MYFNTLNFFAFFVTVFLVYRFACRINVGALVLLAASIIFYVVAGLFDSLLIASLIGLNWLVIATIRNDRWRIVTAVILNIGVLAYIKYRAFFAGSGIADGTAYIDTVLPLGISFYTFQLLAFQIDAKSDVSLKKQSGLSFALFIGFFPQLIAGPIVRAQELLPQIKRVVAGNPRKLRLLSLGLGLCLVGLTKKVIFADSLSPIVDNLFFLESPSMFEAWQAAWLFTFQIYFDFSGYSDIAVGCAYLLGIRLPWNFRTPYMSLSPREFWQRWHITLSTWIRDYLYIPLGGHNGGRLRQIMTLLFVMGLAGLWHGADQTFIFWGLGWGVYIAITRLLNSSHLRFTRSNFLKPVNWLAHMLVVVVLWVFFRAPNMDVAFTYLDAMFSFEKMGVPENATLILCGCASLMLLHVIEAKYSQTSRCIYFLRRINGPFCWGLFMGLCLWLVLLPSYDVNPFIYFRF